MRSLPLHSHYKLPHYKPLLKMRVMMMMMMVVVVVVMVMMMVGATILYGSEIWGMNQKRWDPAQAPVNK